MKILYLHQYFSTPDGSGGLRGYHQANALAAAGHEVHVVCATAGKHATGLDGPFTRGRRSGSVGALHVTEIELAYSNKDSLPVRAVKFVRYAWHATLLALREPCDLVFATSTPLTAAIPGIAARMLRRRRFVFEVRDLWPEVPVAMGLIRNRALIAALSALEWCAYRGADGLIGLSPGMVEGIRRRAPAGTPVVLIPNGCDLELFDPERSEPASLGDIDEETRVAIYTGAHGRANGLDALVNAAVELERLERPPVHIVLVGEGSEKDRLQERAALEAPTCCTFLPSVRKAELPNVLARADVAIVSFENNEVFYYGTSPNKFFDYISAGRPVVVNHPGWIADLVGEHACGRAVAPDDPAALAHALADVATDPARAAIGARARRLAETEFARAKLVSDLVEFVERTAATRRGASAPVA